MKEKNVSLLNSKSNVSRNSQGITLIALVVTIVVLLILAGITITFVLGENGIINMAQRAADATNKAVGKEQNDLADITNQMQNYLNGNGGSSDGENTSPDDNNPPKPTEPSKGPNGKPLPETITTADSTQNIEAEDKYGNPITIPAGFTVVPDGTDNVEYNYGGDKKPNVQDGIVVEDAEGNQFVWIPVGKIKNKDGSTTTIDLARYTFNSDGTIKNKVTDGSELKESSTSSKGYLEELATSTNYGNSKAKEIESFKTQAKTKGGYYLARYEASQNGEKPMSKANETVWNKITQPNASIAAGKMYTNSNYTSDLTNSYAWDTAIVFIQTYGEEEYKDYSNHTSKNTDLAKTGESGDKVLNIYDMASNCTEWTTETYANAGYPCSDRGGNYDDDNNYTSYRSSGTTTYDLVIVSFRSTLYVK